MSDFRLGTIPSSSILHMYSLRDSIWFDPPYQRMSDVWPMEKRQLLVDTILNGYDVPKLYFHEFFPARVFDGKKFKYAIVDGKQRLETIFSFIQGRFTLDPEMEFIADHAVKPGGLTYAELARKFPELKTQFDGFVLPIISILTDDTELIEDMFSRLNEAIPLNAPEKRNALGGPIPSEEDVSNANFNLLEYDRLTQSPNDAVALKYRYAVLRQYIGPAEGRPSLPADE